MQPDQASDTRTLECPHERERLGNARPLDWQNPTPRGPYHLLVIGAGPGGLVAARSAAALGAKVALIERHLLGGDCLNYGCVPSKTMIRTSRLYAEMRSAANFGAEAPADIRVDFPAAMERVRRIRTRISRVDSAARLVREGIDLYFGTARFVGPDAVDVGGTCLRFKKALIATGSRPMLPTIPGLAEAGYLTNETVFDLTVLPRSMLVIGGGPLGCELAQAFCRLGTRIIISHSEPLFLPKEERDAAQMVSDALARDGVEIHLNCKVVNIRVESGCKFVEMVHHGNVETSVVDEILTGIGRMPAVQGLDLEAAGVAYDAKAGVRVDDFLRTSNPRIYAAGDVCLEHKFTDTADASARIGVQNALLLGRKRMSALTIPWCTYTDPEVAHVGIYVRQARERNIPVKTFTVPMHDVDRAMADGEEDGFVKIHVREGTDTILGATIVARHAGEMINGISLAMVAGIGLRTLAGVIHAYPTQAEAIKKAADAYTRTRLSPLLGWLLRKWLNR
ncbi:MULTISPECIES: mercuric reductase [unclassified Variovorax]|uniref:mercuric reductase n=1 Tax=unclassified Variovorax TaxID=663243 RepID=UPI00076CF9CA|nr:MULTISPECIES: mercuric reductase [unclassified Variovorax]KWT91644.1 Mercuric ion reductase [Variovorax sp. WDL1]PNG49024.1 Mercuric reductase [Variovorax sp. B4]PNG49698.1 Mercuric reductase [Variovorax sp. B2]VTV18605.1 Mercuric reductase [Variovorax sp. WDL1]